MLLFSCDKPREGVKQMRVGSGLWIGVVLASVISAFGQAAGERGAPPQGQRGAPSPGQRGGPIGPVPGARGSVMRLPPGALPPGAPHPLALPVDLFTTKNFYK